MTDSDLFIMINTCIFLAFIFAFFSSWLNYKLTKSRNENLFESIKKVLDNNSKMSAIEADKMSILSHAISVPPTLKDIPAAMDTPHSAIIKPVNVEAGGISQGASMLSEVSSVIASKNGEYSIVDTLVGVFRVDKVETTLQDGFRVTFSNLTDDSVITSSLQDAVLSSEHRNSIRNAEWDKSPLRLTFKIKRLHNGYIDAVVVDAQEFLANVGQPAD